MLQPLIANVNAKVFIGYLIGKKLTSQNYFVLVLFSNLNRRFLLKCIRSAYYGIENDQ